jgi:hypothetical protein
MNAQDFLDPKANSRGDYHPPFGKSNGQKPLNGSAKFNYPTTLVPLVRFD